MIPRRKMLAGSALVIAGVVLPPLAWSAPESRGGDASRPNILLILVDDLGEKGLSYFGGKIATPNLDRLAGNGMVFVNAHACPMCAPTRDEMFTGISRARIKGRPGAGVPFFTNGLQAQGYATGMAGKWFTGSVFNPPLRGFDESCIMVNGYRHWAPDVMVFGSRGMLRELNQPPVTRRLNEWEIPLEGDTDHKATRLRGKYAEDVAVDFLCDFMERQTQTQEGKRKPFFAYYSSKLVHVPPAPTPDAPKSETDIFEEAFGSTRDRNLSGVDDDAKRMARERGVKLGSDYRERGIAYLDKMVGRLVGKLEALGILDNTLILFASDNGNSALDPVREGVDFLPGRKGDSREGGTRIPLIAHWPAVIKKKSDCADLVHVQDFGPTFLDLAGAKNTPNLDGVSFAPRLVGKPGTPREYFIGWGAHPSVWLERVRKEVGKPDLESFRLVWIRGMRYKLYNDGRFYDLESDLEESRRILPGKGSREAEAVRKQMQKVLSELGV